MFGILNALSRGGQGARLSPTEAVALAAQGALTVIDVRDIAEVKATGKAKGALHVPLMMLATRCDPKSPECLPGLTPDTPIAVYCASGGRSQMAAGMLAQMGYGSVANIGGLGDWQAAGGPVERAKYFNLVQIPKER